VTCVGRFASGITVRAPKTRTSRGSDDSSSFTASHLQQLGEREVTAFVTSLAVRGVSASTQNQALSAILFLYETVLGQRLPWMNEIVRARRPARLLVVLSRDEVSSLLIHLRGSVWLMASHCCPN
jgi:site-specific recombinase XerD